MDQAEDIDDDRWFDYLREDLPKSLGVITAHSNAALHNRGCSWGLNPPVSNRLRAMVGRLVVMLTRVVGALA